MDIKTYIWKNRMTLRDFATLVGCNYSYMSRIATEKLLPSPELAKKIEAATNGQIKAKKMIRKKLEDCFKKEFAEE